jgi:hypothetical protein
MKRILTLICAGVLMSILCVACEDSDGGPKPPREQEDKQSQKPKSEPKHEQEPNTYVTEHYLIANQIKSDIIIKLHSGEVITIAIGERKEVQKWDVVYEPGFAYARSMYTVDRAVMKIGKEILPDSIWLYDYWSRTREDGEDAYHYSLTFELTVTNELLEKVKTYN